MSARGYPLLLLLLVWTLGAHVDGQTLNVTNVTSSFVEVTWTRSFQWQDVDEFIVHFTATDSADCVETIACSSPTCRFNSLETCGVVSLCTQTNTTIHGGNYTAPSLVLTTGPEPVTNLTRIVYFSSGYDYVNISWVNPSKDSSPCYENTAVQTSLGGVDSTTYHEFDEESTSRLLCGGVKGFVAAWATGGDGNSNVSWASLYSGGGIINSSACKPVGCYGIELKWSYKPLCTNIAYTTVKLDGTTVGNASVTELNITDLEFDRGYNTYIYPYAANGDILSLYSLYCHTNFLRDILNSFTCEPVGCNGMKVMWSYKVQCTGIAYYEVVMYLGSTTTVIVADANVTEVNVTDLESGEGYAICLNAYEENEDVLFQDCIFSCRTHNLAVENLSAVALTSTSINITWDPPVCLAENNTRFRYYDVIVNDVKEGRYSVSINITYTIITDLSAFHEYQVDVQVPSYSEDSAYTTVYTLLPKPDLRLELTEYYVRAEWYYDTDAYSNISNIYFRVTWGDQLQYKEETKKMYFIIMANSTEEVAQVCLTAVPESIEEAASLAFCKTTADKTQKHDGVWIALGVLAGVAVVVVVVVYATVYRRRKHRRVDVDVNL